LGEGKGEGQRGQMVGNREKGRDATPRRNLPKPALSAARSLYWLQDLMSTCTCCVYCVAYSLFFSITF